MDDAIKAVLSSFSPTTLFILEILFVVTFLVICFLLIVSAYKYTKSVAKETRIFDLSKENHELHNKLYNTQFMNNNISNSLNTLLNFLYSSESVIYDSLENNDVIGIGEQFKIINNLISSDTGGSSRKRVSLWALVERDGKDPVLESFYRSANYVTYNSDTKYISINDSIAGRAIRKNKKQFVYDLKNDPDWHGFSGNQKYSAILAVPIKNFGVLTVDFSCRPSNYELQVIELYCYNMALLNAAAYQSYVYHNSIDEGEENQNE